MPPSKKESTFDPEGSGYDYKTARKSGIKPNASGHWPSRDPKTKRILKGRNHHTYYLTILGETEAGYEIYKGKDGHYYSDKKK